MLTVSVATPDRMKPANSVTSARAEFPVKRTAFRDADQDAGAVT
ncbi:hypothetical protein QO005_003515 [Rhizobium paknamense]|uniref:Uncharacterized protein n=1 Tax=Rhizobium paknamense TaxID=1206817 RepID=A0ABU0IG91_9HYPH|nr:hypothetical protein [Rhizobium paknamense]